jgi:hypothetical protein
MHVIDDGLEEVGPIKGEAASEAAEIYAVE